LTGNNRNYGIRFEKREALCMFSIHFWILQNPRKLKKDTYIDKHSLQNLSLVGEATYIQTQRSDVPYLLARITDIKVTKAGHAEFVTRPFHRLSDLPDQIYRKLTVDRQAECKGVAKIMEKIECINFANRELFICDAEDIQREIVTRNQMRGHCKIGRCRDFMKFLRCNEILFLVNLCKNK
jgi:hypothetical protein